jgi:hypothetical protein
MRARRCRYRALEALVKYAAIRSLLVAVASFRCLNTGLLSYPLLCFVPSQILLENTVLGGAQLKAGVNAGGRGLPYPQS